MEWDPSQVVSVECDPNQDPKQVIIILAGGVQSYSIPYTFYQLIQQPLGLPDIIC